MDSKDLTTTTQGQKLVERIPVAYGSLQNRDKVSPCSNTSSVSRACLARTALQSSSPEGGSPTGYLNRSKLMGSITFNANGLRSDHR